MSVVSQIGFGQGKLRIVGGHGKRHPFMLPPLGGNNTDQIAVFRGPHIGDNLTMAWFVVHVLCAEKPELCPGIDAYSATSASDKIPAFLKPRYDAN